MLLYRFVAAFLALVLLAGAAQSAGTPDDALRAYAMQLGHQCPAKRLELLSPADLRDALDSYKRHVPADARLEMDRAEARHCRHVVAGASCNNSSDIAVAERRHVLPALTASLGSRFETCRSQSTCVPASAQALHGAIRDKGAAAVAASLSAADWTVALDEAAAGRADWIDALAAIRAVTDGARSEAIDGALSDALLTNPAEVLRLLATRTSFPSAAWLCQDRAIEPADADVRHHIDAARAAVATVSDPRLKRVRDQCLASLKVALPRNDERRRST